MATREGLLEVRQLTISSPTVISSRTSTMKVESATTHNGNAAALKIHMIDGRNNTPKETYMVQTDRSSEIEIYRQRHTKDRRD